jgi:hypothetical protein
MSKINLLEKIIREEFDKLQESNSFSRQHYKQIADILLTSETKDEIVTKLADMFEEDNPRFSREKFILAAGM